MNYYDKLYDLNKKLNSSVGINFSKYLKYKNKYLKLKEQIGGDKFKTVIKHFTSRNINQNSISIDIIVFIYGEYPSELKISNLDESQDYIASINFSNKEPSITWNLEANINWSVDSKSSEGIKKMETIFKIGDDYKEQNKNEIIDIAIKAFKKAYPSFKLEKSWSINNDESVPTAEADEIVPTVKDNKSVLTAIDNKSVPTTIDNKSVPTTIDNKSVPTAEDTKIDHTIIVSKEIINYDNYRVYTLVSTLNKLINLLKCKGYIIEDKDWIQKRLEFLFKYTNNDYDKTIDIYNKDKKRARDYYNKLNGIYDQYKTYFINTLILNQVDKTNKSYRENMGKINLYNKEYMYKQYDNDTIDTTFGVDRILDCYEFIDNSNKIYFNISDTIENNGQSITINIKFVEIPKIILFSLNNNHINYGYLMEIVDGNTIRDIISNDRTYWNKNEEVIKSAIYLLIDTLTDKTFLINDFAYDNIMWDKKTNTLTYIDITKSSFNRNEASYDNYYVKEQVRNNQVY